LVRLARSDGQKVLQHGGAVRKLGLIGHLENTYPRFIGSDFNAGEKFVDAPVRRPPGFKSREQIYSYHR
jgi:hypothetical protein